MEGSFFVNAASLFLLSSILEKKALGAQSKKEMTTVNMPSALIEGTETIIFFSLFIIYTTYTVEFNKSYIVLKTFFRKFFIRYSQEVFA